MRSGLVWPLYKSRRPSSSLLWISAAFCSGDRGIYARNANGRAHTYTRKCVWKRDGRTREKKTALCYIIIIIIIYRFVISRRSARWTRTWSIGVWNGRGCYTHTHTRICTSIIYSAAVLTILLTKNRFSQSLTVLSYLKFIIQISIFIRSNTRDGVVSCPLLMFSTRSTNSFLT